MESALTYDYPNPIILHKFLIIGSPEQQTCRRMPTDPITTIRGTWKFAGTHQEEQTHVGNT